MADAYVYILRCADGSLYTGWTVDLDRRLAAHAAGTGEPLHASAAAGDARGVLGDAGPHGGAPRGGAHQGG